MSALNNLIDLVEPGKRPVAQQLVCELNFMHSQLAGLRKAVRAKGCTEIFVQGKQEVERLTPAYNAYTTLVTKYGQLLKQLTALLPAGSGDQGDDMDEFVRELRGLK